jgi:ubiquinone/menaquinone biosynthesis C-methylase UbiE
MIGGQKNDYDTRDVDYSLIHGESKEILAKFTKALGLKNGMRLLDVGGGYGSMLLAILENEPDVSFHYDLLDSSSGQIRKANRIISAFFNKGNYKVDVSFIHQNAVKIDLPSDQYDVIVCKMFIHEIPEAKKETVFRKMYAVLKPGGIVVFWNPDLDEADHHFYEHTIRKKDELANFERLVRNRHFLLNSDFVAHLRNAGFHSVEKLFDFDYDLHTSLRLKSEFNDKKEVLAEWHRYIHEISQLLTPEVKNNLVRKVSDDNIHIRFKRAVFKAVKE